MDETETTLDSLPLDILRDIFIRLPVESLGCLAGSCSLFEHLITKDSTLKSSFDEQATRDDIILYGKELTLKSQHLSHEAILSKFINLKFSNPLFLDESLVVAGSCNGLVCFYQCSQESFVEYNEKNIWEHPLLSQSAEGTEYHYRIYIWNPTTHRIRALPKLISPNDFVAFGYDPINQDYKILWVSRGKRNKVEMYSWKNKSWKLMAKNFRYVPDDFKMRSRVVDFEGSLHWVSGIKKSDSHVISVFDMAQERLDMITVPNELYERISLVYRYQKALEHTLELGVFKGYLSLLVNHDEIWSRKKSGTDCSWKMTYKFIQNRYLFEHYPCDGRVCGLTRNGKIMMIGSNGKFVLVDPETTSFVNLKLEFVSENSCYRKPRLFFIDYEPSLESVYPPLAPQVM